ncbi:methylmalonyl-CoA mutase, C-terminal domain/subunit (cobalamin-binding) [Frankia torreyi]|uniref:Methylmalonyl-CoA mutase, C-terminal domain/subunit (Cobalamin-binding) n=1 Tax=Frankia torreyi TaxID=1856 RepID=A0A0D8BB15_9ACTN|nr:MULTISPECIES: cobalamin-dependent protein [Frankia]KJE21275.1 methylmalonyl-CoA mutase, C-terminal domain/subunit (cobalamin-binding) [Frankia torreyi]
MSALRAASYPGRTVIVSGLASDAHTWNLVYLQLLIEELGHDVVNLGPCVPADLLVASCDRHRPALVVLSSVNGHGYQEGLELIRTLRGTGLRDLPVVIGGQLGTRGGLSGRHIDDLLDAGFDAVFDDHADSTVLFRRFVAELAEGAPRALR